MSITEDLNEMLQLLPNEVVDPGLKIAVCIDQIHEIQDEITKNFPGEEHRIIVTVGLGFESGQWDIHVMDGDFWLGDQVPLLSRRGDHRTINLPEPMEEYDPQMETDEPPVIGTP